MDCQDQQTVITPRPDYVTWIGVSELPLTGDWIHHLSIGAVRGVPPTQDTADDETINPVKPDSTCTCHLVKQQSYWKIVEVKHTESKVYGKSTWLYNRR